MSSPDHDHVQSIYENIKNIEVERYFGKLILAMPVKKYYTKQNIIIKLLVLT